MGMWGTSWTDNKVYKMEEESKRQKAVVKHFLETNTDYFQCDENDKALVDYIEKHYPSSKFSHVLLMHAYNALGMEGKLKLKPKSWWIPSGFSKSNSGADPEFFSPGSASYNAKFVTDFEVQEIKILADLLKKEIERVESTSTVYEEFDESRKTVIEDGVAPIQTSRRIKDDD